MIDPLYESNVLRDNSRTQDRVPFEGINSEANLRGHEVVLDNDDEVDEGDEGEDYTQDTDDGQEVDYKQVTDDTEPGEDLLK